MKKSTTDAFSLLYKEEKGAVYLENG